jgi:hypothetical protein
MIEIKEQANSSLFLRTQKVAAKCVNFTIRFSFLLKRKCVNFTIVRIACVFFALEVDLLVGF